VNSDIRTENLKCAYVVSKFIQEDGNLTVAYTSNKTREEIKTQDYREEIWRADVALKWGGPPEKVTALRAEVESAVKAILAAYEKDDPFEFMKMVSSNFKGNRENVLRSVQDQLAKVDNIKFEGVWLGSFVPGDADNVEVSFTWQRRWRVAATGAEERAQGTALFRLEKSSGQWLLQEIRDRNPLF
jgi:hypothetical protein